MERDGKKEGRRLPASDGTERARLPRGREEKPYAPPKKVRKRGVGVVVVGGCSHSIHVTSLLHFLCFCSLSLSVVLFLSPKSQRTSAGQSAFPVKPECV